MQQLAVALSERGHEVAFLTGLLGSGLMGIRARTKFKLSRSTLYVREYDGFDVYRGWEIENCVEEFSNAFNPNLALCFSGRPATVARAFKLNNIPSAIYFRNVEITDIGLDPISAANGFIANSNFTAQFVKSKFSISATTIRPLVEKELYETRPGGMATFINPHRDKGRDIVFELVKRSPNIPFLIVYSWQLSEQDRLDLQKFAARYDNVTIIEATDDMKSVYGRTKILLAPSQWQEAWGRVATEAHFSGIPVMSSDAGGLPESVGPGGVIIPREGSIDQWEAALHKLWYDQSLYNYLSKESLKFSRREEMKPSTIVEQLERTFEAIQR